MTCPRARSIDASQGTVLSYYMCECWGARNSAPPLPILGSDAYHYSHGSGGTNVLMPMRCVPFGPGAAPGWDARGCWRLSLRASHGPLVQCVVALPHWVEAEERPNLLLYSVFCFRSLRSRNPVNGEPLRPLTASLPAASMASLQIFRSAPLPIRFSEFRIVMRRHLSDPQMVFSPLPPSLP